MSDKVVSLVEQLVNKMLTGTTEPHHKGNLSTNSGTRQRMRLTKYAMRVLGSRIMPAVQSDEFHVSSSIKRQLQVAQVQTQHRHAHARRHSIRTRPK